MARGKKYKQCDIKLEQGNYNESIKGNYIQGNCYFILKIEQEKTQKQKLKREFIRIGKLTLTQEYNSNLIRFVIDFFDCYAEKQIQEQIGIVLDISFGEIEEKYIYKNFGLIEKEGYIRFGIKFGTLKLKFTDQYMPPKQRKLPEAQEIGGQVTSVGSDENPEWQFKVTDASETAVLFGLLKNQELGIVNLLKIPCKVEATFQVNINGNGLGITAQDGVWDDKTNKKVKESKLRSFFKKVVEPKLKNNVSKIRLQYDSASNS